MEILELKLFREEILNRLPVNYRRSVEIYLLSLRELEICYKLPANYYRCDKLFLFENKRKVYIKFLERSFRAFRRHDRRKNWSTITIENWEEFIKLLKNRLKKLTNQVIWGFTVSPNWVYRTLKNLSFLKGVVEEGFLLLCVASNPYKSPLGILNLKTGRLKVELKSLEEVFYLLKSPCEEIFLKSRDLCGRVSLSLLRRKELRRLYLLKVALEDNPYWEFVEPAEESAWEIIQNERVLNELERILFKGIEVLLTTYRENLYTYYKNR